MVSTRRAPSARRLAHRTARIALPALALVALPAGGQWFLPVAEPEALFPDAASALLVAPVELDGGWIELTPLASEEPATVLRLLPRVPDDGELLLEPELPPGPRMLCSGGDGFAVACEQIYFERVPAFAPGGTFAALEVRFETGVRVSGRYRLDRWPVAGARVSVVPANLEVRRPYTLPLVDGAARSADLPRDVVTGEDGRFVLPALAGGEYFLETVLPSGRVHRGDPFVLPSVGRVRLEAAIDDLTPLFWDLGDVDVDDGLAVELRVQDVEGLPIAGARVAGRQGTTALDLVSFEGTTDADGGARLSGFTVDQPVHLSCRAPGFVAFEQDYELVPVAVTCILEPQAAILGVVLSPAGLPAPGAVVSLAADESEPVVDLVADDGGFLFAELEPGGYRLTVTAPGCEILELALTLAPGEVRELETIVLLAGSELDGRVVDAGSGEPVAGAEIFGVEPLGSAWAVSGRDGEFTLVAASDHTLELEVSAAGYATGRVTVTPERFASGEPLEVELSQAGWIRVVVWDEAGDQPCQGCPVVIWPSGQRLLTDSWGEAVSGPLAPAYYSVYRPRVTHLGSAVVEQDDAELRYARVEADEIETVRFGEQTDVVRVTFEDGAEPGWRISARTPWRTENVLRAADGSFPVRRRPGEVMELYLRFHDPETDAEVEVWQATLPAELEAGEMVLPRHAAVVSGRARSGFEPLAGAEVRLRSLASIELASVRTRADGTFEIPYMPPGTYFLAIGASNVKFVSIYGGRDLDVGTFDLIPGSF